MPPPSRALLALLTKKCHASQERPQVDEWARLPPQVDGQIEDEQTYRCTSRSPSPHSPQCRRTFPPIATALPEATAAPLPPLCPASCTRRRPPGSTGCAYAASCVHCTGPRSATASSGSIILAAMDIFSSRCARLIIQFFQALSCVGAVGVRARASRCTHEPRKTRTLAVACVGPVWSQVVILGCFDVYKHCTFAWCMWSGGFSSS